MRISRLILMLGLLLCSCSEYIPEYCIGEVAPVHEYFQATVISKSTTNLMKYKDKTNEEQILETNGKETLVQLNLLISCNQTTGITHMFDKNDFKLTDGIKNMYSVGDIEAFEDYNWVNSEIHTNETLEFLLHFKVLASELDEYKYLEIDFKNSLGNSTKIYLAEREN